MGGYAEEKLREYLTDHAQEISEDGKTLRGVKITGSESQKIARQVREEYYRRTGVDVRPTMPANPVRGKIARIDGPSSYTTPDGRIRVEVEPGHESNIIEERGKGGSGRRHAQIQPLGLLTRVAKSLLGKGPESGIGITSIVGPDRPQAAYEGGGRGKSNAGDIDQDLVSKISGSLSPQEKDSLEVTPREDGRVDYSFTDGDGNTVRGT